MQSTPICGDLKGSLDIEVKNWFTSWRCHSLCLLTAESAYLLHKMPEQSNTIRGCLSLLLSQGSIWAICGGSMHWKLILLRTEHKRSARQDPTSGCCTVAVHCYSEDLQNARWSDTPKQRIIKATSTIGKVQEWLSPLQIGLRPWKCAKGQNAFFCTISPPEQGELAWPVITLDDLCWSDHAHQPVATTFFIMARL